LSRGGLDLQGTTEALSAIMCQNMANHGYRLIETDKLAVYQRTSENLVLHLKNTVINLRSQKTKLKPVLGGRNVKRLQRRRARRTKAVYNIPRN